MKIKCLECKKQFTKGEKGSKLVSSPFISYPLCPKCVFLNQKFICPECNNKFTFKDNALDECWKCQKKMCLKCLPKKLKVEGLDFYFCVYHQHNINEKELEEEAIQMVLQIGKVFV